MLVVEGLTCRFGSKAAVDNASFSVAPGSFVGVIGRSGAGKSTLLRMINRLADPTEGRVLFEGVDVTALRGKDLRREHIIVRHGIRLPPDSTVPYVRRFNHRASPELPLQAGLPALVVAGHRIRVEKLDGVADIRHHTERGA